ncbi:MAG: hypothetical protein FJ100_23235 [Deltaproteobacteria bacterium]|nr:hypothetical protein [Deltaproteobacteria bacterium]
MPHQATVVLSSAAPSDALPAFSTEAILLSRYALQDQALVAAETLGASRRSDATTLQMIIAFLITAFCADRQRNGLRGLATGQRPALTSIGAALGLAKLPSCGAVSTFLSTMPMDQAHAVASALLARSMEGSALRNHPLTVVTDRAGQAYAIADVDPTVKALRKRALPRGAELPEAQRHTDGFAAEGYGGRHRGQVIVSACRTQATGAGLWSAVSLQSGNTALAPALNHAMTQGQPQLCGPDAPTLAVVVRIDGAGGNVPFLRELTKANALYLVRSAHYAILQHPDVLGHLHDGTWQAVEDSCSGPTRQALDLGRWPWKSASDANSDAPPITPRMVVTRFRSADPEHKHGAGWLHEGWHYELFATALDGPAWPASDVATLYFGRACLENRFAQENRELGLNRVFSYGLPGQLLATTVGMYVWNRRVCLGAELAGIAEQPPSPAPEQPPQHQQPPQPQAGEDMAVPSEADLVADPRPAMPVEPVATPPKPAADDIHNMTWEAALQDRTGFAQTSGGLLCPNGATLRLRHSKTSVSANRNINITLRAPKAACKECPQRSGCTKSTQPMFRKEIGLVLRPPSSSATDPLANSTPTTLPVWQPPEPTTPPPGALRLPQLIPVVLIRLWLDIVRGVELRVTVDVPPPPPKQPAYIASTPAQRQRRRHTWAQRRQRFALDPRARVSLDLRRAHGLTGQIQRLFPEVFVQ